MPFGAVQTIVILIGCYAANSMKLKGPILFICMLPVVAGTAMLYALDRGESDQPALLAAYYLVAFLFRKPTPPRLGRRQHRRRDKEVRHPRALPGRPLRR